MLTIARRNGGSIDPYYLPPANPLYMLNNSGRLKTLVSRQTVNTKLRNLAIISAGQSNNTNIAPTAYTPKNPDRIVNLNIDDGAVYKATDPLLGCGGNPSPFGPGHPDLRLADLITDQDMFDLVTLAPVALSGSSIQQWDTGPGRGRINVALRRLKRLGYFVDPGYTLATNVTVIVIIGDGETNNLLGTDTATFLAGLTNVINATRTEGFAGPVFVAKQTLYNGVVSVPVQLAQAQIVNPAANIWAGANADALFGNVCVGGASCRLVSDNSHWSDAGSASYAAAWLESFYAYGPPFFRPRKKEAWTPSGKPTETWTRKGPA